MIHSLNQREHTDKMNLGCLGIVIIAICIFGMSFFFVPNTPETYSVKATGERWQSILTTLDNSKSIMDKSTLPANVVAQWRDSLTSIQQTIIAQVEAQIKADTTTHKK